MLSKVSVVLGFAVAAVGFAVSPALAQHGHNHGGSSSIYGGNYGSTYGGHHGGSVYGQGRLSGYNAGYNPGWNSGCHTPSLNVPSYPSSRSSLYWPSAPVAPRQPVWHDTTHLDYHPSSVVPHGNHYHYVPGHYDVHHSGHFHY